MLDAALPVRFGFREFWIKGRDFYLNGSRIFLSALPLDNAQVGAAAGNHEAARKETMLRVLKATGITLFSPTTTVASRVPTLSFEKKRDPAGGRRRWDAGGGF